MDSRIAGLLAAGATLLVATLSSGCRTLDSAYGSVPCSHLPDARAAIDCANARRERNEAYQRERERAKARSDRSQN